MGTVISSENRSGGQGKTTLVVNIATILAKLYPQEIFLIINTDPQNDCSLQLGIENVVGDRCLSDFVIGDKSFKEVAVVANSVCGINRPNLYYVPTGPNFAEVLEEMQADYGIMMDMHSRLSERKRKGMDEPQSPAQQFLQALSPFKQRAKPCVVLVDCPPSLGPLRQMVHHYADFVLVPVIPGAKEVNMTVRHTNEISQDIERGARSRILGILPNQFNTQLKIHKEYMTQLEAVYNGLLLPAIPSRTAVGQAAAKGCSIFELDPTNEVALAYKKIALRIAKLAELPDIAIEEEE